MALDFAQLDHFTGTEDWWRHPLSRLVYTDGVKHVADTAGAHWLIDSIAAYQLDNKVRHEPFQVWKLKVTGSTAILSMEDGNGNEVFSTEIEFTDFPEPGITFWMTDGVILLPSEY